MVPLSGIGFQLTFGLFDVNVALCTTSHWAHGPSGWYSMVTFDSIEWDWDRISKIRARLSTRNERGYNSISGLYRFR